MKRAMPLILMLMLIAAGGAATALVLTNPAAQVRPANVDFLAIEAPTDPNQSPNQPLEVPEPRPEAEAALAQAPEVEPGLVPAVRSPQSAPVAAPARPDSAGLREDIENVRKILEQEVVNDPALRPVRFSGTVTDHLGAGVEGAVISIDYTQPGDTEGTRRRLRQASVRSLGKSKADGTFNVVFYMPTELGASREAGLLAGKTGHFAAPRHTLTIVPDGEYTGIVLMFPASAGVTGRVVDTEHNPIAGARIDLLISGDESRRSPPHALVTSDADGNFTLTGVKAGSYTITASAHGYGGTVNAQTVDLVEGVVMTLNADVVLKRSTAIKFKAVCADHPPTGRFMVTCTDARGMQSPTTGYCDENGNAMIVKVPADTVRISIRWNGYKINGKDVSDDIHVSVVEGQHTDLGEIMLELAPRATGGRGPVAR